MELTHLGPYELGKTIGKGGMGAVYEATDSRDGRRVAIKALNPQLAQAEGFRERFEAEIESLKALRHEGIVRLYGYGEQDEVLFYSMELVDGTSLEEELKAGRRFNWREVADIAIQVCRSLKHAHDHGVVHRDIKPANILIDDDDRVKLADFGIARLFGSTQLTTAGGVLGTADYMSPEQAEGRPVSERCDQYSLGGVMYALLAGRTPFRAKTLPEMLQLQRFAEPEPVRRYAPDTPEQMERAISQLLAKDPADRFPNTIVLSRHLEAMVKALSRPAADDFALAEHGPLDRLPADNLDQALAATRHEQDAESLDAATLRPEDLAAADAPAQGQSNAATLGVDAGDQQQVSPSDPTQVAHTSTSESLQQRAKPRPATFTTVEDISGPADDPSSWRMVAVQTLGMLALLAGLVGLVLYVSRPSSADDLYAIMAAANIGSDGENVRSVEKEIDEFLARFPADPRVAQVRHWRQLVAQEKWERQLEQYARFGSRPDEPLLPIESHYLRALQLASNQPERAAQVLESILGLYAEAGLVSQSPSPGQQSERRQICLQLAAQRLEKLRDQIDEIAAQQLPELRQRLESAAALPATKQAQAKAIYRAIVDLYGEKAWAAEIVSEAKNRLER